MTLADLPIAELAVRLASPGVRVRTGPFVINLGTTVPALAQALHLLYRDFPVELPDAVADFHVRVDRSRGLRRWWRPQARFIVDGKRLFVPGPLDAALPMLEWGLNWCVGLHSHRFIVIHSAVVERAGHAAVLPGRPGSGKSTLCAALVHRGWRLLSDEFALVDAGTRSLLPLPRPISLKNESIGLIRSFAPEADLSDSTADTHKGTVAYVRPPSDSVARAAEPAHPGWLIFPTWDPESRGELSALSTAQALLHTADNSFNYSLGSVHTFEALTAVVEACDRFTMRYSTLEDAVAIFDRLERPRFRSLRPPSEASEPPTQPELHRQATPAAGTSAPRAARESILLRAFRRPDTLCRLPAGDWDRLLFEARHANLLARLAATAAGVRVKLPVPVRTQMDAAEALAAHQARMARWEVNRIDRALAGVEIPVILLKGAAYVMADLPIARGRLFSDVDVMVPKESLSTVEAALMNHGWEHVKLDPYDQRYYREWMHELPPLRHRGRSTVVDVHHNILPETGRLHPDARRLFAAARPLGDGFHVLAPADMVLHAAAHLFQDGELQGGLRDLLDLDGLLRHFGTDPGFWDALADRAMTLDLTRPLHYALRFTAELLETPLPPEGRRAMDVGRPPRPVSGAMAALVRRALAPERPERPGLSARLAREALFLRSHWLRMPPLLLGRHLLRKSLRPRRARAA